MYTILEQENVEIISFLKNIEFKYDIWLNQNVKMYNKFSGSSIQKPST